MARLLKQVMETIKHFLQPKPLEKRAEDVTIKKSWKFSELKSLIDKIQMAAGNPIYEIKPTSRIIQYHKMLIKINYPIVFIEYIVATFFTKQNLLGFISTCESIQF